MENLAHIIEFVHSKCLGLKVSVPGKGKMTRHLNGCKIFFLEENMCSGKSKHKQRNKKGQLNFPGSSGESCSMVWSTNDLEEFRI